MTSPGLGRGFSFYRIGQRGRLTWSNSIFMSRCIWKASSIKGNLIHAMTSLVRSWMLDAVS